MEQDPRTTRATCTQISMTCTTSMTDWVHGDLWLCSDGLLRRSRGWRATMSNVDNRGARQIVDAREIRPTQAFSTEERLQIAASDKRNWWIPWDQIAAAKLGYGPISLGIHVTLNDGRKISLRWFKSEGGMDRIKAAMEPILGPRLTG